MLQSFIPLVEKYHKALMEVDNASPKFLALFEIVGILRSATRKAGARAEIQKRLNSCVEGSSAAKLYQEVLEEIK